MSISKQIEHIFRKFIPSPFSLAVILSLFTLFIAFFFTGEQNAQSAVEILQFWQAGTWDSALLVFMVQMMLILVLGHILVLSKPVSKLISILIRGINSNGSAVIVVSVSTMLVAFFNWGLGLIFGAIMARKVAEAARERNFEINYPLIGAAGYVGLMVWHAGISGSAPLKAAESGHLASLFPAASPEFLNRLPESIPTSESIFASWNLLIFGILLVLVPLLLYLLARFSGTRAVEPEPEKKTRLPEKVLKGAEKFEHSKLISSLFALLLLGAFLASYSEEILSANLSPNMLNFLMLGLCILLHRSFFSFLKALDKAIVGAAAILIQFPLYFGIMGVMRETGLVSDISGFFVGISSEVSLPVYSFFSAGLVNIFVPSGGGQWAVQGPIILESALELGVPLNKAVMALAYGDQITNMLQPFWALPLLAITRLKAREILPYTLILMLLGICVYVLGLLLI
ncbi:short-chain fatty acid transporter [Salegentibacter sp. HM20]